MPDTPIENPKTTELGTSLGGNVFDEHLPPMPEPEHQHRINKSRRFELIVVIALIIGGTAFLMFRNSGALQHDDAPSTLHDAVERLSAYGCEHQHAVFAFDRQIIQLAGTAGVFDTTVHLIGTGMRSPLETAIIALTPKPGPWSPTESDMQNAVNDTAALGAELVPSSIQALVTAVNTMVNMSGAPRPHLKGVAGTDDGWKITYITYRNHDNTGTPLPALLLILQTLDAGANPTLENLNRQLYESINSGQHPRTLFPAPPSSKVD